MKLSVKYGIKQEVGKIVYCFPFPFLSFSFRVRFFLVVSFSCLIVYQLFYRKAAPVVIVIWMLPVKPVFQREDIAVCVSRDSLASIAK